MSVPDLETNQKELGEGHEAQKPGKLHEPGLTIYLQGTFDSWT